MDHTNSHEKLSMPLDQVIRNEKSDAANGTALLT